MKFHVITIFPDIIRDYTKETILQRAIEQHIIVVSAINLRDFTTDKHRTVDDTPYGGGAGMVLKPEPIYKALEHVGALRADYGPACPAGRLRTTDYGLSRPERRGRRAKKLGDKKKTVDRSQSTVVAKRTVLLSPRGKQFDQRLAEEWSHLQEMTFVCGRYEGVDQRVVDYMVDEEISIGPYVLAGGELGVLVIIEAVSRLIPGVLGNLESLEEETHGRFQISDFGFQNNDGKNDVKENKSAICNLQSAIEYPHYTKPADFMGWNVPDILLSGDHKKIAEWREEHRP